MSSAFISANPAVPSTLSFSSLKCRQHASSSFTGSNISSVLSKRAMFPTKSVWFMKVGIFYSTTTGNTEEVAQAIKDTLGSEADDPIEVGEVEADKLKEFEMLFVGAPTWNTGADEERTGTAWDEFLYDELPKADLSGVPVAVFGLGDAEDYSSFFCDAMEEVHDCFAKQGAKMVGYTPADAYEFEESKSVRDGRFIGLPVDNINGPYDVNERVGSWCKDVMKEVAVRI